MKKTDFELSVVLKKKDNVQSERTNKFLSHY